MLAFSAAMRLTRRPLPSSFLPAATVLAALGVVVACGSTASEGVGPTPSASSSTSSSSSSSSGSTGSSSGTTSSSSGGESDAGDAGPAVIDDATIAAASCSGPVPAGAPTAAALPQYAGVCPAIAPGGSYTEFKSSGANRKFLVYTPANLQPTEKPPVIFLWHWLGGDPEDMANVIDVQNVVDTRRFVAVIPSPKGDVLFRWPFEATQSQGRVDEELAYFDDMLACVGKALPINKECVASMGVSAGALWTAQLASLRSNRISSFVSLSGGTGGVVRNWTPAAHPMPGLVLWGGKDDMYPKNVPIMNFEKASKNLEGSLVSGNHFLVECVHNCGHAVPPFDPPAQGTPKFDMVWNFILRSPFWLPAGASSLKGAALPSPAYPSWCAVGQGNAVPRPNDAPCP